MIAAVNSIHGVAYVLLIALAVVLIIGGAYIGVVRERIAPALFAVALGIILLILLW